MSSRITEPKVHSLQEKAAGAVDGLDQIGKTSASEHDVCFNLRDCRVVVSR